METPDTLLEQYQAKARSLPSTPVKFSALLRRLDEAVINALNNGGPWSQVDQLQAELIACPDCTFYKPRPIDVDLLTWFERAALQDCYEGSTIDRMADEWHDDPLAVSRLRRSMEALHDKLQAVGFNPSPVWF